MNRKHIFLAMFRALDCLYDESPSKPLGDFLSEANPYLFKDRCSADPAVLAEFSACMDGDNISAADAYSKVKEYLAGKELDEKFAEISMEEWERLCQIIENEER